MTTTAIPAADTGLPDHEDIAALFQTYLALEREAIEAFAGISADRDEAARGVRANGGHA